jgi:hypothetical protein
METRRQGMVLSVPFGHPWLGWGRHNSGLKKGTDGAILGGGFGKGEKWY